MWYSLLVLIPSKQAVVVFVTNDYIAGAEPWFFKLVETVSSKLPDRNSTLRGHEVR